MNAEHGSPTDYRLHDRVALEIGWHCLWCGVPLEVATAGQPQRNHCGRPHARKHGKWRARSLELVLRRCPHPEKRAYGSRGTALRFALAYQQDPYLCGCGAFHLTCRRNATFAAAMAHLATVVSRWELAS